MVSVSGEGQRFHAEKYIERGSENEYPERAGRDPAQKWNGKRGKEYEKRERTEDPGTPVRRGVPIEYNRRCREYKKRECSKTPAPAKGREQDAYGRRLKR